MTPLLIRAYQLTILRFATSFIKSENVHAKHSVFTSNFYLGLVSRRRYVLWNAFKTEFDLAPLLYSFIFLAHEPLLQKSIPSGLLSIRGRALRSCCHMEKNANDLFEFICIDIEHGLDKCFPWSS